MVSIREKRERERECLWKKMKHQQPYISPVSNVVRSHCVSDSLQWRKFIMVTLVKVMATPMLCHATIYVTCLVSLASSSPFTHLSLDTIAHFHYYHQFFLFIYTFILPFLITILFYLLRKFLVLALINCVI